MPALSCQPRDPPKPEHFQAFMRRRRVRIGRPSTTRTPRPATAWGKPSRCVDGARPASMATSRALAQLLEPAALSLSVDTESLLSRRKPCRAMTYAIITRLGDGCGPPPGRGPTSRCLALVLRLRSPFAFLEVPARVRVLAESPVKPNPPARMIWATAVEPNPPA